MRVRRAHVAMALGAMVLGGCSSTPDPEESQASVEEMRDLVTSEVKTVSAALEDAGVTVRSAAGSYSVCGVEPASSVEYAAGMATVRSQVSLVEQVEAIGQALEAEGWSVTHEGSETDDPYVNLERGEDMRASASVSRRHPGTLAIEVVHDCVDAAKDVIDPLLGETDRIIG